jgi:L-aminoadipate-semialdehyde dehydrogenase
VPENDNLEGARHGLKTGYGQTKWVCEKVLMTAAKRGLQVRIVRPGYVVGDSVTAGALGNRFTKRRFNLVRRATVTNTDDFVWRLVKGCIQIGLVPDINNTINMVPVDHVARCVVLAAITSAQSASPTHAEIYHVTCRPRVTFNFLLTSLALYGYGTSQREYLHWRADLEKHVLDQVGTEQDNALFPLLHFVLDDLPTSTKAAELSDENTQALLKADEIHHASNSVSDELLGKYFAWLVKTGFLPAPSLTPQAESSVKLLPTLQAYKGTRAVGRTGGGAEVL